MGCTGRPAGVGAALPETRTGRSWLVEATGVGFASAGATPGLRARIGDARARPLATPTSWPCAEASGVTAFALGTLAVAPGETAAGDSLWRNRLCVRHVGCRPGRDCSRGRL